MSASTVSINIMSVLYVLFNDWQSLSPAACQALCSALGTLQDAASHIKLTAKAILNHCQKQTTQVPAEYTISQWL
jgi:hypothetical protein